MVQVFGRFYRVYRRRCTLTKECRLKHVVLRSNMCIGDLDLSRCTSINGRRPGSSSFYFVAAVSKCKQQLSNVLDSQGQRWWYMSYILQERCCGILDDVCCSSGSRVCSCLCRGASPDVTMASSNGVELARFGGAVGEESSTHSCTVVSSRIIDRHAQYQRPISGCHALYAKGRVSLRSRPALRSLKVAGASVL